MVCKVRSAVVGIAALAIVLVAMAADAFALLSLRINQTATTAASRPGDTTYFRVRGLASSGTCSSTRMGLSLVNLNQLSIPAGGVAFSNCTLAGTGLTVTVTSAWTGRIDALLTGSSITGFASTVTLPFQAIRVASATGCTFTLTGTRTAIPTLIITPVPLGQLAFYDWMSWENEEFGLTVDSTNGAAACTVMGIGAGRAANIYADYHLNPSLSGTLVNLL